jgi:predicted NACHT family NTPase
MRASGAWEAWLEAWAATSDEKARTFEIGYVRHIETHLDDVQLVGITADPAARRQRLSKAYIPLSLSSETATKAVGGPVYFESLLDALTPARNRVLVVGAAGGGKTTLLRWAAIRASSMLLRLHERGAHQLTSELPKYRERFRKLATGPDDAMADQTADDIANAWWLRVPFLIPLRLGTPGRLPAPDEYPKLATDYPMPPPACWVESILQAGRGLLLIDGIDEIPRADRPQIQAALEGLSALPAGNYVVFTTRPDVVDETWFSGQELLRADVSPLSATDRDQLIEHWHAAAADQSARLGRPDDATPLAKILRDKLRRLPEIAQLATNPLLCASICALHYSEHGYLPKGQADLCKKLCEMLLERRDRARKIPAASDRDGYGRLDYAQKQVIAQTIAQDMVRAGEATIEARRVDELIDANGTGSVFPLTSPLR